MGKGFLRVEVAAADNALPLLADVIINTPDGAELELITDASGRTASAALDAPDAA